MPPEQRQVVNIPFSSGLQTKGDQRAQDPPALDICRDAEFDDIGGLRTRKPQSSLGYGISIAGPTGALTMADVRRIDSNGTELLVQTKTELYSLEQNNTSGWVYRGDHLAVAIDETPRFATTDDQIDPDRAELHGVIFHAWNGGGNLYIAATDKATGAVLAAPMIIVGSNQTRPRLVALQTKVMLFNIQSNNHIFATVLDPANITGSFGAGFPPNSVNIFGGANQGAVFDVAAIPGTDTAFVACQHTGLASYDLATVTTALSVATANKARTADGPIAVAVTPDGLTAQIVRGNGTNIQGDLITIAGFVDVFTAQAFGTGTSPINQVTCAFRSVTNGNFRRCYAFWSSAEAANNSVGFSTSSNWFDTNNAHGTAIATFVPWVGVASHAFDYNGSIFVWLAFGQTSGLGSGAANASATGNFQNAYYLYRDDQFLVAKCAYNRGGGLCPTTGRLPSVALTSGTTGYTWAATIRRRITVGQGTGTNIATGPNQTFSMREPMDVAFTFDSNDARRVCRIGSTFYIASGENLQYDGASLTETGFHVYPWYFDAIIQAPGSVANGTYGYKPTYRWQNGRGEIDRSTTATVANATMTGGPSGFAIAGISCPVTHKTANQPACETWRTQVNPPNVAPFYLITSLDPSVTSNPNRYVPSAISASFNPTLQDRESDATATTNPTNPENGAILQSLAPPSAKIIIATQDRIFLGAVAGDPDRIWYSKQRNDGEVIAFNDGLVAPVPRPGGVMTALFFLEGTLFASRQRALYAMDGQGFDNAGGGGNFTPRIISTDIGVTNADAWCLFPDGIFFKSNKGWYKLGKNQMLTYVGAGAAKWDAENVLAVHCVESQHQIRIVTDGGHTLVYDYLVGEWAEWTIPALHATMWNGNWTSLSATLVGGQLVGGGGVNGVNSSAVYLGPMVQAADFSGGTNYGMEVETAWFKPSGLVGQFNARWIMPLGEFRSNCLLRLRYARNYRQDGSGNWEYSGDRVKTPQGVVGGPLQVRWGPPYQGGVEAVKVRITVISSSLATIKLVSGGATVLLTSAIGGAGGNSIVLANATGSTTPSATDGTNLITLSGPSVITANQVVDAVNRGSRLAVASLVAGSGSEPFLVSAFAGTLSGGVDFPTGEGIKLTGLGLEIGQAAGLFKLLPQAQKG